mmetsp:Transcript_12562/g.25073  ORF Transcript_12562/g.25073 Transcript_12562/m.25073 type:complete len:135 (+) Transcript_12562:572-976(+)
MKHVNIYANNIGDNFSIECANICANNSTNSSPTTTESNALTTSMILLEELYIKCSSIFSNNIANNFFIKCANICDNNSPNYSPTTLPSNTATSAPTTALIFHKQLHYELQYLHLRPLLLERPHQQPQYLQLLCS